MSGKNEFEFLGMTQVAGRDKMRLRCPVCIEQGMLESRFNVSPKKTGRDHKCRFCGSVLRVPKENTV